MSETEGIIDEHREDVLAAARSVLAEFSDVFVRAANNATKIAELSLRLNEQAISLSEKWILLDGATIALSLALIGSLISRTGRVPRHPFEWLVCPSWFLLLVSMYFCWLRMIAIHHVNVAAVRTAAAEIEKVGLLGLATSLTHLLAEAKNAVVQPIVRDDINKAFQAVVDQTANATAAVAKWEDIAKTATQDGLTKAAASVPLAHAATFCTVVALVLLAAFAITAVLAL
jgi:hypothetical protein